MTPAFLDWLRPGMRQSFEQNYVAGQDSVYRGVMQGDAGLQSRGNVLIALWSDGFWKDYGDSLFARAYR